MAYRRTRQEGGACFFTVDPADQSSALLIDRIVEIRGAVRITKQRHPFEIVAWIVLSDHVHAIWTLPRATATVRRDGC